jgi:DNA-binding XRE family transcriptional regulator
MDLVRQLRVRRGWSQEQLAEVANVGRATVQRIERGRMCPSWETAQALGQAFDVDASRIRSAAGLAALVSATFEITLTRELSDAELRRLPPCERAVFANYRAARVELAEAGTEAERLAAEFACILDVVPPRGALEEWASTRRAVMHRLFAAQRRVWRALSGHLEAGTAVTILLQRFI